jgi:hypothetical protein
MCPICASPDTPIATPRGDVPIAQLKRGDLVYSVEHGATVVVPLVAVASTPVTAHQVLRVLLDDATTLEISPGHPTADGRIFSDLAVGSMLDEGHRIISVELIPYTQSRTYDILPASSTGTYYAGGTLIGSSLHRDALRR